VKLLLIISFCCLSLPLSGLEGRLSYVKTESPCALDPSTVHVFVAAMLEGDRNSLQNLKDQGKVIMLAAGTELWVQPSFMGISFGLVRNGRYVGKSCHLFTASLQKKPISRNTSQRR
jgi:hypothetical protein